MGEIEAPGEQLGDRLLRGARRSSAPVRSEQRDTDRPGVEALRMRSDHVAVDSAEPAFVHRAEAVDEEVVADVVPAVPLDVVELDALHDRRGLGPGVVVPAGGVMNDREAHLRRELRRRAPDRLVGSPGNARHDRRGHRRSRSPERNAELRAPYELRANSRDPPSRAHLDPVGRPDPPRASEPPTASCPALAGTEIRAVLVLRRRRPPLAPAPGERARAERDASGAAPVDACEREARVGGAGRLPGVAGHEVDGRDL